MPYRVGKAQTAFFHKTKIYLKMSEQKLRFHSNEKKVDEELKFKKKSWKLENHHESVAS